jgi:AcrR family transcriptional regulator
LSDLAHPEKRKPSIKGDEARRAYIDATIDLLREIPISEITTRKIAERAGIDRSVITRHFGTIDKVFLEVCKELILRTSKRMLTQPQVNEAVDPELKIYTRVLAHLVLNEYEIEELLEVGATPILDVMERRQSQVAPVSDRMMSTFNEVIALAGMGLVLFREARGTTIDQVVDALALVAEVRKVLPEVDEALGWDQGPQVLSSARRISERNHGA